MDRREFALGSSLVLSGALATASAFAQVKLPEEGVDYLELNKRASTEAGKGKIEVIEFFWYNCPHCNRFEPQLEEWIKKQQKDVVVRRMPVAFRDEFVPQQRLFYTLEALGKLEQLHKAVFKAIHEQNVKLNSAEQMADWIVTQGVDRQKFLTTYNSFSVSGKAGRATQVQNQYEVRGVPALGIAGRYYTDGSVAQSMARALFVTDYLLAQTRKSMA
jgi:protein dithiol oxidoreductase (disulfide-forming)